MACHISPLMMFVISSQFCQCVPFEWLWVNAWNVQNDLRGKITHKQTNVANYLLGIVSFENILNILYIHRHDPIEMTCMMADDWSACFWQNVETSSLTHGAPSNGVRRPEVEKSRTLSRSTAWEKGALWVWENGQLNKIKKSLAFGFTVLHLQNIIYSELMILWNCNCDSERFKAICISNCKSNSKSPFRFHHGELGISGFISIHFPDDNSNHDVSITLCVCVKKLIFLKVYFREKVWFPNTQDDR